jgi:hypothetical protein
MNTTAKRGALIASKALGPELNAEVIKYKIVCACLKWNAGQYRNRNIPNKSFENWQTSNKSNRHWHITMSLKQKLRAD